MINRLSAALTDADKTDIKTSFLAALQKMPFLITANKEEKGAKQNLGDSLDYVLKGINVVQNRPEIMPGTFVVAEFPKDVALYQQLYDVYINLLPIKQKLEDTMTILGQEMMAQANQVYGQLQSGAKNDASLKPLLDEMKTFYEKSKKKPTKATDSSNS
jgi:hypothetical protein